MADRDITKSTGADPESMANPNVGPIAADPQAFLRTAFDKEGSDASGRMMRAEEPDPVAQQYTREQVLPDPPAAGPTTSGDTYSDKDRTRAQNAMKRDGFDPESVDMMFSVDADAATRNGLTRHERQTSVDAKFDRTSQDIAELKRALAEQKRQVDTPAARDTSSNADLDVAVKALAEELGLEGKDSRAALGAFAKVIRAPLEKQLRDAPATAASGHGDELVADFLVESARDELVGEYPQLKDADVFANVKLTAQSLAEGRYAHLAPVERVKASFRSAAMVEVGGTDAGAEVDLQTRQTRLDAQPPRPSEGQTGAKPAPTKDRYAGARSVLKKHGY